MRLLRVTGLVALVFLGIHGWNSPADAAYAEYRGSVGGGPACSNSSGSDQACDGLICQPTSGISCTSTATYSIPPTTVECTCQDTAAGC